MKSLLNEIRAFSHTQLVTFMYGLFVQNCDDDKVNELAYEACKEIMKRYRYADMNTLIVENTKLRELVKLAIQTACFDCPHKNNNTWRTCEGCNLYEYSTELGIEVENG